VCEERLVGSAGFFGPPDDAGEVEIGYSVCRSERRKGIGTAVVAELCGIASERGCASVRAETTEENVASIAVLQRNQFVEVSRSERDDGVLELLFRRALQPHGRCSIALAASTLSSVN
jgi:[ribosomal protein S5]-alanine N-acetyltransferase